MRRTDYIIYLTLLPFIVQLVFLSCSEDQTTNDILKKAENLAESAPDSAYLILKNAGSTVSFNPAQRAEWNLLTALTMNRAKIKSPNDSIIQKAVAYYNTKNNEPHKSMLALYYMGRINRELGDAPKAQDCYLKAREKAIITKDSLHLVRINSNIGMLYLFQGLSEEALPYLSDTKKYFIQQNDSAKICLAIRDLGRAYSILQKPDSALFHYKKALKYSTQHQKNDLLNEIIPIYTNQANYDSAYVYLHKMQSWEDIKYSSQSCLTIGQYFAQTNQVDSANYYLMKCINSENIRIKAAAFHYLYQMAKEKKDLEKYISYQTKYEELRDSIMENTHTETLLHLKALYNYEKKENQLIQTKLAHAREKQKNTLYFAIILVSCLLIFFFIHQMRLHRRRWEVQQLRWDQLQIQQQQDYSEQIDRNNIEIDRLTTQLTDQEQNKKELQLYIERLELRNEDIKGILTSNRILDKEIVESPLYQKLLNPGNKEVTEEDIRDFLLLMDRCYPTFRTRILQLCPDLEEENMRICYLTNAGLPPKSIAIIMKKTDSNLANIRSRLSVKMFGEEKSPKIFDQKIKLLS